MWPLGLDHISNIPLPKSISRRSSLPLTMLQARLEGLLPYMAQQAAALKWCLDVHYRVPPMDAYRQFPQGQELERVQTMARGWMPPGMPGTEPMTSLLHSNLASIFPNLPSNLSNAETQALLQALQQRQHVRPSDFSLPSKIVCNAIPTWEHLQETKISPLWDYQDNANDQRNNCISQHWCVVFINAGSMTILRSPASISAVTFVAVVSSWACFKCLRQMTFKSTTLSNLMASCDLTTHPDSTINILSTLSPEFTFLGRHMSLNLWQTPQFRQFCRAARIEK